MRRIKCFMVERTGKSRVWWRRYAPNETGPCASTSHGYCEARVLAGDVEGDPPSRCIAPDEEEPGAQWPTQCERCGYHFTPADTRQVFSLDLWHAVGTEGPVFTLRDAPAGAMWFADWMWRKGPDGHALVVQTPTGEWTIDGRASNCTLPNDAEHHCWVRHGTPPEITVDKIGHTCAAGGGSIMIKDYHAFLRNGYLEEI